MNIKKRFFRLLLAAVITLIICKVTTFGWRFWSKPLSFAAGQNKDIADKLKLHVYKLSNEIGDININNIKRLNAAADYISKQLASFGYEIELQPYKVRGITVNNIIATKKGNKYPDRFIIVGAHYDNYFNPGADDNASGVAGLLELARLVSKDDANDSIRFVAFVNEEPPFFKTKNMGSRVYAKAARLKNEDIKGVVILEMIGYYSNDYFSQRYPPLFGLFYPNQGSFVGILGNFNSWQLLKKIVSGFKNKTQLPFESVVTFSFIGGIDFSDNGSFWEEGYPAVMVTDTAVYRNENYHRQSDTYNTLHYGAMAEVVRILGLALNNLDDK